MPVKANNIWNDFRLSERLAEMWRDGAFADDIAADLSTRFRVFVSKNMIISRRKRIPGLAPRPSIFNEEQRMAQIARRKALRQEKVKDVAAKAVAVKSLYGTPSLPQPAAPVAVRAFLAPIGTTVPGTMLPPVGRPWRDIVVIAERDGWFDFRKDSLPSYNRSRVTRGVAPLAIDLKA